MRVGWFESATFAMHMAEASASAKLRTCILLEGAAHSLMCSTHPLVSYTLAAFCSRRFCSVSPCRPEHNLCRAAAASTLQTALKEQLARDPGAVPAFVAGLRHYLHQPLRLQRLLQPCIGPQQSAAVDPAAAQSPSEPASVQRSKAEAGPSQQHDARAVAADQQAVVNAADAGPSAGEPVENGDSAAPSMAAESTLPASAASATTSAAAKVPQRPGDNGDAPCLLSVLTGIAPLRPALVDLLMDTMVAACQHGRGGDRASIIGAGAGSAAEPSLASAVATGEHSVKV